jgi:hypothetical protein
MTSLNEPTEFKTNLLQILDETFIGPPSGASGTIFLDATGSWEDTLAGISADDASRPSFDGATTIAAQVGHTAYYLENLLRFEAAETESADWPGSWRTKTVNAEEWDALRARLARAYLEARKLFAVNDDWSGDRTGGSMAVVVHSAYHLGAVRQLLKALQS